MATNKVFDSFEHKKQYIREKRKSKKCEHAICVDCLLPFAYRTHSPSLFLCAECYDLENETSYRKKTKWIKWIALLQEAGFEVGAHRIARDRIAHTHNHDMNSKTEILLDEYMNAYLSDGEFAKDLILHEVNELEGAYNTK